VRAAATVSASGPRGSSAQRMLASRWIFAYPARTYCRTISAARAIAIVTPWAAQGWGPRWSPPRTIRSAGIPASSASRPTNAANSAGFTPV
jgi:hypothetical protein